MEVLTTLNKVVKLDYPSVRDAVYGLFDSVSASSLAGVVDSLSSVVGLFREVLGLYNVVEKYRSVFEEELGVDLGFKRYSVLSSVDEVREFIDFSKSVVEEYSSVYKSVLKARESGVKLGVVKSCLEQLSSRGDVAGDIVYCLDFVGREPVFEASLQSSRVPLGVWCKVVVDIVNKERVPLEIVDAGLSHGFEVKRSIGCKCSGGGSCSVVLYVKALESGILPTDLVVKAKVLDRVFEKSVPIEFIVESKRAVVEPSFGKPLYPKPVSTIVGELPHTGRLYSVLLEGLVDYVISGEGYSVSWRKSYTSGWVFEGSMDCIKLGCGGWGCSYLCRGVFGEVVFKVPKGFEHVIEGGSVVVSTGSTRLYNRIRELSETLMALEHPGVIKLIGYGRRLPVLVYEYANQGTLAYQLDHGWSPGFEEVVLAGLQVCDALRYIHSRGLVHGDIKSGNVFVKNGVVKVGDFSSLTKLLSRTSRYSRMTSCTPGYCAPEQVYRDVKVEARRRGVENRVDVYQTANLLIELLGLETIDGSEVDEAELDTHLEPIENSVLRELLKQMLQPEPWKRPSIEEVEKTLYRIYKRLIEK